MPYKTGEQHHRCKISAQQVADMRRLRERSGMSFRQIGKIHNVSMWTVRDIVEYRTRTVA
jgi:transposase